MAGHSKFKNIMHRKGRQDAQRSKLFSKLSREITVAAKMGDSPDPDMNPSLRLAISTARGQSMPKDNINKAIQKAFGNDASNYLEITYEGYATQGIAVIVQTLTDNKNRTAADVRAAFTKNGGSLAETGAVTFMFERIGSITYAQNIEKEDVLFEKLIDLGAEDLSKNEDGYEIITKDDKLGQVASELNKLYGDAKSAELIWRPLNLIDVQGEKVKSVLKIIAALEDCDNVQNITANFNISDEDMEEYSPL